jgi:hypothetical protein
MPKRCAAICVDLKAVRSASISADVLKVKSVNRSPTQRTRSTEWACRSVEGRSAIFSGLNRQSDLDHLFS